MLLIHFRRMSFLTFRRAVSVLWLFLEGDCAIGYKPISARWSCILWKTSFFVSFERKARLLTGLKFLKIKSRPGFLSNGHTSASFQISGKIPASYDFLMIVVMTGRRASHLLTSREGMRSSGQDFNAEFWISDLTLLSDEVSNSDALGITLIVL